MIRKFIAAFMIIFFAATTALAAENELKAGDVIQVTGIGIQPENFNPNDSFAKTFARQVARMDALRQLAEVINGINVEWDDEKDYIKTWLPHDSKGFKLLERNARAVGDVKFYFSDKGRLVCEVTMELIVPDDWKE